MKYFSHRGLIQHTAGFPHSVLTSVQVESLVLQDLPLPHDVPHLPVQEPGEGRDHPLVTRPDVFLLQQSQSGTHGGDYSSERRNDIGCQNILPAIY